MNKYIFQFFKLTKKLNLSVFFTSSAFLISIPIPEQRLQCVDLRRKEIVIRTDSKARATNILWHNYSNVGNGNIFLSSHSSFWVNKIEYTVEIWVCSTNPKKKTVSRRRENFFNYRPRQRWRLNGECKRDLFEVRAKNIYTKPSAVFPHCGNFPLLLASCFIIISFPTVSASETRETQVTFHLKSSQKQHSADHIFAMLVISCP